MMQVMDNQERQHQWRMEKMHEEVLEHERQHNERQQALLDMQVAALKDINEMQKTMKTSIKQFKEMQTELQTSIRQQKELHKQLHQSCHGQRDMYHQLQALMLQTQRKLSELPPPFLQGQLLPPFSYSPY